MKRCDAAVATIIDGARVILCVTAVLSLALLSFTHVVHAAGSTSDPDGAPVFHVEVSRGELTVDIRQIPLARVLEIVGERAGLAMTVHGDLGAPITDSFVGLPLEEGIRRLARGHSTAVTYGVVPDGSGTVRLAEVRVMASGSGTSSPPPIAAPPRSQSADSGAAEAAGEPALTFQIGEIHRLTGDAALGSQAALARLAEIGASDAVAVLRQQAVAALGRLTSAAVEPVLAAALADTDVEVRLRAVRGLRRFGTDTAVQSIAEVSLGDADPHVRLAAVTALTSLPGGSMLRGLAKASSDPDDVVRAVAIRGLAWWSTRPPVAH
jgi:hypothetical protein